MGHDIRRELKIIPAQARVVEHKRAVYSCRICENHSDRVPVVKAQIPEPIIKGRLRNGPPIVLYEYQPTRSSAHPKRFLSGWKVYLHGYKGYHNLPQGIIVIGCWVHLRRKFDEARKTTPMESRPQPLASEAIKRLGVLFHLGTLWKDTSPDGRQHLRLKESKPLAKAFFAWLEKENFEVLPKSPMGIAINYALGQRRWLMNFYMRYNRNRKENPPRKNCNAGFPCGKYG